MLMSTPSWLYYLFGALMLAVAAYSLVLLILSVAIHRPTGWDVDVAHLAMGTAMAGMFVGDWAFGRSLFWELVFSVLLVWFVVRSIQSLQRYGVHLPHESVHAVMSFAMLLMYWFPPAASASGGMSMGMGAAGARPDPGLMLVLAFALCASAVFTLANPIKGASHHGTHVPVPEVSGAGGDAAAVRVESAILAPRLEDLSHVVMCVAMAFMLILMI